jgi:hypothetical protein
MRLRITCTAIVVVVLGMAAPAAQALRALPTYSAVTLDSPEPEAGAEFGGFMRSVGDLDGDGVNDVAIASEIQSSGTDPRIGRVFVFSGRTRDLIRTIQNPDPQPGKGFGNSIIGIGDSNADGVPDLAIGGAILDVFTGVGTPCGAPEPNGCNELQGRVYIISGRTGSLLRRIDEPSPQAFAFFGFQFAVPTGDVNGDGFRDFVETAEGETINVVCDDDQDPATPPVAPCPSVGAAYSLSGRDGSVIHRFDDPDPEGFANFGGGGTSDPGDIDGDGVDDLVLGASNASGGGRAYLFSGQTGLLIRRLIDPDPPSTDTGGGVGFGFGNGTSVEPGDVNADGVNDVIVSAPGQDVAGVGNAGRIYLLSGADGSPIRTLDDPAPNPSGSFGFFHANAGDLNGDGVADILAMRFIFPPGAYAPDPPPGAAGWVFDGATGAALVGLPGFTRDGPGSSVATPGDVNGDGYPDYFMGGRLLDSGAGANSGRVIVALSQPPPVGALPAVVPVASAPVVVRDTTRPVLRSLSISPGAFRAARSGASIVTRGGARVSFTLSEKASVSFVVERAVKGRRVGGRCVTATVARRRTAACTRYVVLGGRFTHAGRQGVNRLRFSGRIAGRRLSAGRYRLRARATDPAGNTSALKRSRFRIAR